FLRRFDALTTFEDVVADRLFYIHVLAGLAGPDRDQRMPVIARGYGDHVQIFVVERLANVLYRFGGVAPQLVDLRPAGAEQPRVRIDQVSDLGVLILELVGKGVDVRLPPAANAGHAHA